MTKRRRITFVAGALTLTTLAVGLGAVGAIAASDAFSPDEHARAVIDDAAAELGVEPDALSDALKNALSNRIDEAVDAGQLTKEQASRLKEHIDSREYPFLFGPLWGGRHFGHLVHPRRIEFMRVAAEYLVLSEAELRERLDDQTLAEIARGTDGKSVDGLVGALVAASKKAITEARDEGRIPEEHAAELEARLEEHVRDLVNGEFRRHRFGGYRFSFGPGAMSPRGPPLFGPHA